MRRLNGEKTFCPYLYQGQSVDKETGLAYNRFRYYDNESGNYLSQDPIGLMGGKIFYGYVKDSNAWVDSWGLVEEPVVKAAFEHGGKTYNGVNPLARDPRVRGDIPGLSATNNDTYKMHAEIDAMHQAKVDGVTGGHGVLKVEGKVLCPYCKGDVKKMAAGMGLESLTIHNADGKIHVFLADDLRPIKNGGKGYTGHH